MTNVEILVKAIIHYGHGKFDRELLSRDFWGMFLRSPEHPIDLATKYYAQHMKLPEEVIPLLENRVRDKYFEYLDS